MRTDLPDVNVLVALLQPRHVAHGLASSWFNETAAFATTPVTEMGLVRLALNPKVMGLQVTATQALGSLASLRADARATFVPDDASLAEASIDLRGLVGHRHVTDLHLVELAARHAMTVVTLDSRLPSSLLPDARHHVRVLG